MSTEKTLNEIMEFDLVIEVDTEGIITERHDLYAPTLMDGELDSSDWEFFSTGYTGQYGYNGPIMHDSEQLSGGLEHDILTTPGIYVCLVSYYSPDEDDSTDETTVEGWAVARMVDKAGE